MDSTHDYSYWIRIISENPFHCIFHERTNCYDCGKKILDTMIEHGMLIVDNSSGIIRLRPSDELKKNCQKGFNSYHEYMESKKDAVMNDFLKKR